MLCTVIMYMCRSQVIADDGKAVLVDVAKRIKISDCHKTLLSTT